MSTIPSTLSSIKAEEFLDFQKLAITLAEATINEAMDACCDEIAKNEGIYCNGYRDRKDYINHR